MKSASVTLCFLGIASGFLAGCVGMKLTDANFFPASVSDSVRKEAASLPKDRHEMPTYPEDARQRYVRTTAYSDKENESGAFGKLTATGSELRYGKVRSAAADWSRYPIDTTFKIKGLPYTFVVEDFGSALCGSNTLDLYFPTLDGMEQWGTRNVEIRVTEWGSWERSAEILRPRQRFRHCRRMYSSLQANLPETVGLAQTASEESAEIEEIPRDFPSIPSETEIVDKSSFTWNMNTSPRQREEARRKNSKEIRTGNTVDVAVRDGFAGNPEVEL